MDLKQRLGYIGALLLVVYVLRMVLQVHNTASLDSSLRPHQTSLLQADPASTDLRSHVVSVRTDALNSISHSNVHRFEAIPGLTNLSFYLWDTDPKPILMLENSHLKWYSQGSEKEMIELMRSIYKSVDYQGVVVDMGINDGYIAALAASYGMSVIAVDAQPECVRRFRIAALLNDWKDMRIYNKIMMNEEKILDIPNGVCVGGGRFQNGVKLLGERGVRNDAGGVTTVHSAKLDDLVGSATVVLFHLDVEGAELSVLHSAQRMLTEKRLLNLIFEFAPHRWASTRSATRKEVVNLFDGFECRHLDSKKTLIRDWEATYDKTESEKGIIDIWCSLKKK